MIYVTQGILVIFFAVLAYQILKRRRQRINLIFSGFFFSMIIGFLFNMSYYSIQQFAVISPAYEDLIIFLHFLSWFFVYFGTVFILIVHMIILESTLIYSIKRQNRYILLYGLLLFIGMLIQILIPSPLVGIRLTPEGRPGWTLIFFIYVILITSGFSIIPVIISSFKIYHRFETNRLKKKWFYYLVGSLGLIIFNLYPIQILNLLTGILPEENGILDSFRLVMSVSGISVILWVLLMYYGIGSKLKE
ncbi:MAG: hypothetical protein ACFE9C_16205 [Candidatus Hodarchaeota archaeon]